MLRLIPCILYIFFKKSACKHKRKNIVTVNVKNNRNLVTNHFFSFFKKTLVSNVKSSALFELELTVEVHSPDKLQLKKGRRLHITDERFLKEAEKMVCDEVSVVLHIDRNDVLPLVLAG